MGLDLDCVYLASTYVYMNCFLPSCRPVLVMNLPTVGSRVRFVKATVAVAQFKVPKMDSACRCQEFETPLDSNKVNSSSSRLT
jgi:hypothetical protein